MLRSLIFLICALTVKAAALPCLVQSTNLGGGLFSYTFQRGDTPYVWGLSTNGGAILMPFQEVLEIYEVPGWAHSVDSSGWITWTVTNGIIFLDEPVTFLVQSRLTESTMYSGTGGGFIGASVYSLPAYTNYPGWGIQWFDFVGPRMPHLDIARSGTGVTVQWPADAQGMRLEACDSLDHPVLWGLVTNTPVITGSNYMVELPATDRQRFFRIVLP